MPSKLPGVKELIGDLVATPSVSSVDAAKDMANQPIADCLAEWLECLDFAVEQVPVPGQPGKVNVIGTLGQGPGGLVLAGHTDTVPFDEDGWRSDPFQLHEADGRLYGLGTCDMKAFLALALEAARGYQASDLENPLIILGTADEETAMSGAKALVEAGRPLGRHAIIGEPTSMRPVRMHKGMMMEEIRVLGHSGHSSDPSFGANAMEGMHRVIAELLEWRDDLGRRHHEPAFGVPVPTLNLGYVRGGDNPNRICASCELGIDLRPLPGMDRETLRAELKDRLSRVIDGEGLALQFETLFEGTDPMETSADASIVRAAEALTGHSAEAVAFSTEAPYLAALGMDVVVLGPGDIEQAHQPDEFLDLARVQPTLGLLDSLIRRFCVNGAPENA